MDGPCAVPMTAAPIAGTSLLAGTTARADGLPLRGLLRVFDDAVGRRAVLEAFRTDGVGGVDAEIAGEALAVIRRFMGSTAPA